MLLKTGALGAVPLSAKTLFRVLAEGTSLFWLSRALRQKLAGLLEVKYVSVHYIDTSIITVAPDGVRCWRIARQEL